MIEWLQAIRDETNNPNLEIVVDDGKQYIHPQEVLLDWDKSKILLILYSRGRRVLP